MVEPLKVLAPTDLPTPVTGKRPRGGTAWPEARRQAEAIRHAVAQSLLAIARSTVSVSEEARSEVLLRHVDAWVTLDARLRTKGHGRPTGPVLASRKAKLKAASQDALDLLSKLEAEAQAAKQVS